MKKEGIQRRVDLVQVRLEDDRAKDLEVALISEMDRRYRSGGPGPVVSDGFDPPDGYFVLALLDDRPVGCGGFRRIGHAKAEIKRMYVDPSVRGKGVGRQILQHLEERALAAGYLESWLEAGSLQPEAISLYVSIGYGAVPPYGEFKDDPRSRCFMRSLVA
jgi:GNAT superfamily N-acetyltransferase